MNDNEAIKRRHLKVGSWCVGAGPDRDDDGIEHNLVATHMSGALDAISLIWKQSRIKESNNRTTRMSRNEGMAND